MEKLTLYIDMDGVLSHFEKAFRVYNPEYKWDRKVFHQAILEGKIFETLEWMPNGERFIEEIRKIEQDYVVHIEMLTSCGTSDKVINPEVARQKTQWLADHGITWKPNFVSNKLEKSTYATPHRILIDDHAGCTGPFVEKGGVAFQHLDSDYMATIQKLRWFLDEYHNDRL